ncbi:hypothetical protein Ancab_004202 [Ancistrocladus abbreviatus]
MKGTALLQSCYPILWALACEQADISIEGSILVEVTLSSDSRRLPPAYTGSLWRTGHSVFYMVESKHLQGLCNCLLITRNCCSFCAFSPFFSGHETCLVS